MHEVMAMVKQLGIPIFFFFFFDFIVRRLRWNELIYIISNLSEIDISDDKINKVTCQERRKILNSNPWHF